MQATELQMAAGSLVFNIGRYMSAVDDGPDAPVTMLLKPRTSKERARARKRAYYLMPKELLGKRMPVESEAEEEVEEGDNDGGASTTTGKESKISKTVDTPQKAGEEAAPSTSKTPAKSPTPKTPAKSPLPKTPTAGQSSKATTPKAATPKTT
jgi:hypothetical protein